MSGLENGEAYLTSFILANYSQRMRLSLYGSGGVYMCVVIVCGREEELVGTFSTFGCGK